MAFDIAAQFGVYFSWSPAEVYYIECINRLQERLGAG
jgi:hypothetical protein